MFADLASGISDVISAANNEARSNAYRAIAGVLKALGLTAVEVPDAVLLAEENCGVAVERDEKARATVFKLLSQETDPWAPR